MHRSLFLVFPVLAATGAAATASCGGDTNLFPGSGGSGGSGPTSTGTQIHHATSSTTGSSNGGAGGATSSSSTGGGGTVTPGIISQSALSLLESETHVAIAPSGFLCATWIAEQQGGSTNGYRFSKDSGATWEPVASLASPSPEVASDPVLAVDAQQNFWVTWVGFQFDMSGNPFDMHVYVAKAPAGTTTFGAPVEVTSNPSGTESYDKPWIAVTNKGTLLVTYAATSSGDLRAARSIDDGASWGTTIIGAGGTFRNLAYPCPPQTGSRIYVAYFYSSGNGGIVVRWSDDDGATFDPNNATVVTTAEQPGFDDPTCVSDGNDVWVSYGLSNDGFNANNSPKLTAIRVAHSTDGGVTFAPPVDAHDAAAGTFFMHPQLVRETGGAAFDLVYYAGMAEGDVMGSYRRSRSVDGNTWAMSAAVKSPMLFTTDRTSPLWLGDYVGLAYAGGSIYTTYADNTVDMYSHIGFAKIAVP